MNMQIIDDITRFIFIENELEPADAVLIPGGSLAELPQEAAKCWKENLAPIVVPSGKYSIKTDFFMEQDHSRINILGHMIQKRISIPRF